MIIQHSLEEHKSTYKSGSLQSKLVNHLINTINHILDFEDIKAIKSNSNNYKI